MPRRYAWSWADYEREAAKEAASRKIVQGGAEVARVAHNHEDAGSIPAPATEIPSSEVISADRRGGESGQAPAGASGADEGRGIVTLRMPARPGTKIDLRTAPSAMEQRAASWRAKA